jgi:hypothetical protein
MSGVIEIAAEAEKPESGASADLLLRRGEGEQSSLEDRSEDLPEHNVPATVEGSREIEPQTWHARQAAAEDRERERRTYRGRAVAMLRRYMKYSIETGRLPSLLGREFFRAKVTSYTVVTFEDRVIFVHDMERCLDRLDEFSRQLIARHILQEHDRWATAKLLHCNEKTVRRYTPVVLDMLIEILLEVGLMERLGSTRENRCQGGEDDRIAASDWEDGK